MTRRVLGTATKPEASRSLRQTHCTCSYRSRRSADSQRVAEQQSLRRVCQSLRNRKCFLWDHSDVGVAPSTVVFDLTALDQARLGEVCRRYGVAELYVFGSVARGDARPDSDLDLLYVLVQGRHLGFSINRLEDELSEIFGRPVDLVSKTAVHRRMRYAVLSEARQLYAA